MTAFAMRGGILVATSGGVKGNCPHMPGAGSLPKRMRGAGVTPEQAFRGIGRNPKKGAAAEATYAVACEQAGKQRLRAKYRRP